MAVRKECTVMFYMASDNPLAISVVSQLKAIKAAGFHKQANVIVQFDPFTEGTPTHIFDVNLINKLKSKGDSKIGFDGDDSFVRNMIEDKLWGKETGRNKQKIRDEIKKFVPGYNPPEPPNGKPAPSNGKAIAATVAPAKAIATVGASTATVATMNAPINLNASPPTSPATNGNHQEVGPEEGLASFLKFCQKEYPANHYLLFILGHGVVVGNDVFLFDENAVEHSLTLGGLHRVLKEFTTLVDNDQGKFDLVGFHSCSVSSLEVAYELRDTARYMLASQGTAFVGSWPYRQILVRIFNDIQRLGKLDDRATKDLLVTIFRYCLHNSTDFLLAGYPFDLCLCDLSKIYQLEEPLKKLSQALKDGLTDAVGRNLILLAHWKSQSFFKEMYTDLADFCFCLQKGIDELPDSIEKLPETNQVVEKMLGACKEMLDALAKEPLPESDVVNPPLRGGASDHIIICSEFAGPEYQYAHGLSVYFPWAEPSMDGAILDEYQKYELSQLAPSWLEFLKEYFDKTKRSTRRLEQDKPDVITDEQALLEDKFSLVYGQAGPTGSENALDQRAGKTDPKDATGGDCGCPSIKNYPRDTRGRRTRLREPAKDFSVGQDFLRVFSSAS